MQQISNIVVILTSLFRDNLALTCKKTSPHPSQGGGLYPSHNLPFLTSETKLTSGHRIKFSINSIVSKMELPLLGRGLGSGLYPLFLLTLFALPLWGQGGTFPVQVIPQATPPAPIYISNYADASTLSSPLRVQIILNDFEIVNREVRLKTYFQGSALSFQSNDFVVGASPLFLEGGIPLVLTNVELAPYFRFENITGINGNQYSNTIPEGAYQFCVEVYDVLTGSRLSNRSCAISVVFQNEPPFLVMPRNKTNVDEINPQYTVFQWTPRSINVSNVEYELSLVEIWDNQVDPQQAFLSSPPVFQTTTTATTYVYGPTDPLLLSGKNYAWRVQAKARQGIEEIGLFKNQGYSEIFSFSYAGSCDLPVSINHEVKGSTNANIFWDDFSTDIPEYTVRYRQKNVPDAEWFLAKTTTNDLTLWNLKSGTAYEYQLRKKCAITESAWSFTKEFTTFIADDVASVYECGITPDFALRNTDPLGTISVGDKFIAGDFPITLVTVSGSNGRFTGKGYVTIPYLNNIKVAVAFTNVLINTDKQLAEGSVITKYDPSLSNILDVDDAIDTVDDVVDSVGEFFEGDNDLDEIKVDWTISKDDISIEEGMVVITNPNNGVTTKEPLGDDMIITDQEGNTYYVDPDGKITEGEQISPGGEVNPSTVSGVSSDGELENLTAENIIVKFNTKGTYGFDQMPEKATDDLKKEYQTIKDFDGNDYVLSHHAVKNGGTTQLLATITIQNNAYTPDQIVFKNKQGKIFTPTSIDGNTATIILDGVYTFENETIYALVPSKEDADKQLTAGAFILWHLAEKTIDVAIVSVGASVSDVATTVNTIFENGLAKINFKNPISIDVNAARIALGANGMDVGESPFTAAYNDEQKALRALAKSAGANDSETYYVIVLGSEFSNTKGIAGFMPLQRQFGFVFQKYANSGEEAKGTIAKTVAHEIGHGIFALQHPFSQYDTPESSTDWLMDYSASTGLPHTHWSQMHDPTIRFYVFQDEEDGELAGEVWFTPDWRPIVINGTSTISYTTSSSRVKGTLPGFKIAGKTYTALFSPTGSFVNYHENGKSDGDVYDILPISESDLSGKDVFLFVNGTECNYAYSASYEYVVQNKSAISFEDSNNNLAKSNRIKCSNCEKGQEFIAKYKDISDPEIQAVVVEISKLICAPNADPSFIDELEKRGISNMFGWQQVDYYEGFGDRSLEAFKKFKKVYELYIAYFNAAKEIVKTSEDRKAIIQIAFDLTLNQLKLLSVNDKLHMLRVITSGRMGEYWTSTSYNIEALALKVIESIIEEQSKDFIDGLTATSYEIDGTPLYRELFERIDDVFGSNNFTTLSSKFNELAFQAHNLNPSDLTNQQIDDYASESVTWDVVNKDYWIIKLVDDRSKLEVIPLSNGFLRLRQNCTKFQTTGSTENATITCIEWEIDNNTLLPFDLVAILVINDINLTQPNAEHPFDFAVNGKVGLVPVVFLEYLDAKKKSTITSNFIVNTLTIGSIYLSGAEIIAAKGAMTLAVKLAMADLFVTFTSPYFLGSSFYNHASSALQVTFGISEKDANEIATILQVNWTVVSTVATLGTAKDLATPQKQIEAIATYKALAKKIGDVEASKVISTNNDLAEKTADSFKKAEEFIRKDTKASELLDEEILKVENKLNTFIEIAGDWNSVIGKNIDEILNPPIGYDFYFKNGKKWIRRKVASNPDTPRLTVQNGNITRYTGNTVARFTSKQISDYVELATKNNNTNKVMLGMWDGGGASSYIAKAGNNHTYFDFGDDWDGAYKLVNESNDEIWKINKTFIDNQKAANKEFWFSHDPFSPLNEQFFAREVNYLIDLGVVDFVKEGNLWKALW